MAIALWSILPKLPQMFIYISYNGYLLTIILNIDSTVWKIKYGIKQTQKFTGQLIEYDTI